MIPSIRLLYQSSVHQRLAPMGTGVKESWTTLSIIGTPKGYLNSHPSRNSLDYSVTRAIHTRNRNIAPDAQIWHVSDVIPYQI